MIPIMVVEDKHPILRSIVAKIEKFSPECKVVATATDGITALEQIRKHTPSIIFTDIRMPGIDGLQLISEIRNILPDAFVVIISAYSEFEYAREAMKLGVTEYLLKPVKEEQLHEILRRQQKVMVEHVYMKEKQIFEKCIKGKGKEPDYNELNINEDDKYVIMLICANSFPKFPIDLVNPFHEIWNETLIVDLISSYTNRFDQYWILDGLTTNEVILLFRYSAEELHENFLVELSQLLIENYEKQKTSLSIMISKSVNHPGGLHIEYQINRMLLSMHVRFSYSTIFHAEQLQLHTTKDATQSNIDDKKLITLLRNNRKTLFLEEVKTLIVKWEEQKLRQHTIEGYLMKIMACFQQEKGAGKWNDRDMRMEIDELFMLSRNYKELIANVTLLLESFFYEAEDESTNQLQIIVDKIDRFFEEHLAEEISIEEAAQYVALHPSYLSRVYKKRKGCSPIEHLTQLRINKAKELLLSESSYKFKDIAEMVGYSNQYYFSKVFKLMTGMTPSQFKNDQLNAKKGSS